jgi:UDP-glucose 4-epimerase
MTTQEFIEIFERVNRISLLKQYASKRPGDKDVCVADVDRLNTLFPDFNLTDRDRWFMIN